MRAGQAPAPTMCYEARVLGSYFWGAKASPVGADAVFEDGSAVLGDGDDELGGEGGGLGVLVGGTEHFRIATDGFVDLHGDGAVFVVAQGNFKFHLPGVGIDALVVRLFVLRDDVKSVADVDVHEFVFRGVVDAVFAGKENAAL